jgi:hypothetical protein
VTSEQLMVAGAIGSWKGVVGRASKLFDGMTDEQLQQTVAPGRNRIIYLLGHLTATHDSMLPLLRIGERLHPELDAMFLAQPDRTVAQLPAAGDLKTFWSVVNDTLLEKFDALSPDQWLERHSAVSEADFVTTPTRNRLAVLLSRTNHTSFHLGQMILAPKE